MSVNTPERESTQEGEIYNPFEVDIHSLSLPSCSPSVFSLVKNNATKSPDLNDSFRWSIGQVAKLRPAMIDESTQPARLDDWDAEKEGRAQKAIETFFLQNSICPSPWTEGAMAFKHVTFSPNLASTAYFTKSNSSYNVYGNNDYTESSGRKDAWTQTTLTVPNEVDLFQLLGQFFTFLEEQNAEKGNEENDTSNDGKDLLSTSTLRRKLFTASPNRLQSPEAQGDCDSGSLPPLRFCTPEKPVAKPGCTPSTVGTFFSSSPISVKNCSISSSLVGQHRASPPLSPIFMEKHSSKSHTSNKEMSKEISSNSQRTPDAAKNHLKSILKGSRSEEHCNDFHKRGSTVFSVSMASESSIEDEFSQDINMDVENGKCDSGHTSSMQTSCVQFSVDELALNQATNCTSFYPSVLSHDTGYQTKSYESGLELGLNCENSHNNNVEIKEKMVHNWLTQSRCSRATDSDCLEVICENEKIGNHAQNECQDSLHLSQLNWKPSIFSTPH